MFPIAVSNVSAVKMKRRYTNEQKCDLDIKTSRNIIGMDINLSQECNSMLWDQLNAGASMDTIMSLYNDICILNVMSSLAIDSAKKEFNINLTTELRALSTKYKREAADGRKIKPNFFAAKDRSKGYYDTEHKVYSKHATTMDYLQTAINQYRSRRGRAQHTGTFLPFSEIVTTDDYNHRNIWKPKVERAVDLVRKLQNEVRLLYQDTSIDENERRMMARFRRQDCIDYVGEIVMTRNTMIYFLKHLESDEYSDSRRAIFNTLFGYPNTAFFNLIQHSAQPIPMLTEDPAGEIQIFDYRFRYDCTKNGQIT